MSDAISLEWVLPDNATAVSAALAGPPGSGFPAGGALGQFLKKASATDFDTLWAYLSKSDVGLGNVDNTADTDKPVSTAQAAADSAVASAAASALSGHAGNLANPHSVTKAQVGLGSVENTALSTWAGSGNLTTLGTIGTGVWQGSVIGPTYGGTGLSALGAGVAAWLGTPSSANLAAAVTDETGSGALVFGTGPTISSPAITGTLTIDNDAKLLREAANALAMRNGASAQSMRWYANYTDGANYARIGLSATGSVWQLLTEAAGTGSVYDMRLGAGAGGGLYLRSGGADRWVLYSTGVLNPASDNAYDLASNGLRVRSGYFGTSVLVGGAAPAGASGLATIQAFGSLTTLLGGNSTTDSVAKGSMIGLLHYLAAQPPMISLYSSASGVANTVNVGGGTSLGNAATTINFYTAADTVTTTGTARWRIDSSGHLTTIPDNAYDIGSPSNRPRNLYLGGSVVVGANITSLSNTAGLYFGVSSDTALIRDTANTLALRNGTSAQVLRLYNTYTDGSNYERGFAAWVGNEFRVGVDFAGTGTTRPLVFQTAGVGRFYFTGAGNFLAYTDNAYDIGANGANRPRNLYLGGTIITGGTITSGAGLVVTSYVTMGTSNSFSWSGRAAMRSPSDGVIVLADSAGTSFTSLDFGGTTSSFPALKRSSATLQARLADDSGFTAIQGKLTAHANAVAETITCDHTIVLYDAAGTAYRVPCAA